MPKPVQIPISGTEKGLVEPNNSAVTWSTANLGLRFGADAASAASASILVAPIITIIDRSIVAKASSGASLSSCLLNSLRPALSRPHRFVTSKPFLLIFSLYFSTYLTANTIDTLTSTVRNGSLSEVSSGPAKFVATSAVNMSLCVYKDSQFAKMFGGPASSSSGVTSTSRRMPRLSYILFAARDSLTIFASFNLPPLLAPYLSPANLPPSLRHTLSRHFPGFLNSASSRQNTAQFLAPAAVQIFSTPVHLLGLDLYNRQSRLGAGDRFARVARDWGVSALARMGRIVPAFGVGGVVNADLRRNLMARL